MLGAVTGALILITGVSGFTLPKDTEPTRVALASDGAVWMTNEYGGVTRLAPDGRARSFLDRGDEYVRDLAPGPNGSVQAASDRGGVQVDTAGRLTLLSEEVAAGAVASVGGVTWFAHEVDGGHRASLVRVDAAGARPTFAYREPRDSAGVSGIAVAADGAAWFTERGTRHAWIGRMSTDGAFVRWALPRSVGREPERIAAGADGTLWVTGRHVIVRVTPDGRRTSFRVPGEAAPHDIVAGAAGGMWFTSDECLARIDGAGAITTWRVPEAQALEGLAAAAGGTFWLADRIGNAIRHFDPAAMAPAPCGAPTISRTAGQTTATVAFERIQEDFFWDLRVRITRRGVERLHEAPPATDPGTIPRTDSRSLTVRDLDGDGEPEVLLTMNWSGTQCCSWTRIYRYDAARETYAVRQPFWGNYGAEPVLRDPDGDGRPELLSLDGRFTERFVHNGVRPVRIWAYRHGRLRDVTSRHPRVVRQDAARLWRLYEKSPRGARSFIPSWTADQYRLGRRAYADRVLGQLAAAGELEQRHGYGPRDPAAFVAAVKALARRVAGLTGPGRGTPASVDRSG